MIYTVKNQVSLFDVLTSIYGALAADNSVAFCLENDLDFNAAYLPVGEALSYIPATMQPPSLRAQVSNNTPPTLAFNARYGQNTLDSCLNMYGTLDSYIKSLLDNNLGPMDSFNHTALAFTPQDIPDVNIYNKTTAVGIIFSTGDSHAAAISGFGGSFEELSYDDSFEGGGM